MEHLFQQTILVVLILSAIPLLAGSVSGLAVALLQSITQVSEQTTSYLVRVLSVCAALFLFSALICEQIQSLMQEVLAGVAAVGRG